METREAPHAPNDPQPGRSARALGLRLLAFVALFMLMQTGWEAARDSWIERLWVHDLTVRSATELINLLTPQAEARAEGTRIVSPGGGLNVKFGCEGTDVVFMLAAAFMVFPMQARHRLWGMSLGLLWVLALNQARILGLFYAFRADQALFDTLHNTGAPLLMVALTGIYFHLWLQRSARLSEPA
jgi:exosortase family protein XrtM